ncbi:MAG: Fe-S cluster assembly protein SufB [Candidatus Limnocylindria bacterium]
MAVSDPQLSQLPDAYKYGWYDKDATYQNPKKKGLSADVVREISQLHKQEPQWMTQRRLKALRHFESRPMPNWGADLSGIDFQDIYYFLRASDKAARNWEDVPDFVKRTFDQLGIPQAEQKYLAGVGAQYDSEVVYHNIRKDLEELGVLFMDTDTALREHEDLVREYLGTVIPANDNKLAALNTAVWSGGSFVWVPPGVKVDIPLQAYFRINSENMGQFERTLIIAEEGASVHYVEGCVPVGEQVSRGDRWANIESIRPGDSVVTADGNKHKVSKTMVRNFAGDMIHLVPQVSGYNTVRVTPEHPVLVVRREAARVPREARHAWLPEVSTAKLEAATPEYVRAGAVERGDFLVFPIVEPEPAERFSYAELRLLGFYLSQGSTFDDSASGSKGLQFTFDESERERAREVELLCRHLGHKITNISEQPERHAIQVSCTSPYLKEFCEEHAGKHSGQKRLSERVMASPAEDAAVLLDAYLAGDGSRHDRSGPSTMVRAATASRDLAPQLQELFGRTGIFATITVRKGGDDAIAGRPIQREDQYILMFSEGRTMGEVRRTPHGYLVPIGEVERVPYDGLVFNLEVPGQESYLIRGAAVHNCTAPIFSSNTLHSAVVEIIVKKDADVRYTTIQNWSHNVYNLVTKRAVVQEGGRMSWIDANLGSKVTMKYPSVYLVGERAHGEVLSVAFAGQDQHQDAGAKMVHAAPNTTSLITSKGISRANGKQSYRGLVKIYPGCKGAKSTVRCDALMLDDTAQSATYPYMEIDEDDVTIGHEASVSKVGEEQLFYLMSRGLSESEATAMIVNGFIEPIVKTLPMDYAIEMNRLISLQMAGAIG